MGKLILILFLLLHEIALAGEVIEYKDAEGIVHYEIKSSPSPTPPSANEMPTWKTELDDICNKSKNTSTLSDSEISTLIDKSDTLKTTIETMIADPTYKYVNLRLVKGCRDLLLLESGKRKQQREYNSLVDSLKSRLKNK